VATAINDKNHGAIHFKEADHDLYLPAFLSHLKTFDIILVEGYKGQHWPKIWVSKENRKSDCPEDVQNIVVHLAPNPAKGSLMASRDDLNLVLEIIKGTADSIVKRRPLLGGILIGGKSRRMGCPKTLIPFGGRTLVEHLYSVIQSLTDEAFLLGEAPLPHTLKGVRCLPDLPYLNGPLRGILSAHSFYPNADWLIAAIDMPKLNREFLNHLVSFRKLGYGASVYFDAEREIYEPLCTLYSPELLSKFHQVLQIHDNSLQKLLRLFKIQGFSNFEDKSVLINLNTPLDVSNVKGKI
jgi:molybdopterin-guanine dinucleotide biosynthesis protein A